MALLLQQTIEITIADLLGQLLSLSGERASALFAAVSLARLAAAVYGARAMFRCPVKREAIWLILPVVICLSQRLSHACLSISVLIL